MAKLSEEKELKTITKSFSAAVATFTRREYEEARKQFGEIVEKFRDSEHYSVLEIVGRSNVYVRMVEAQLNPQKIELKTPEDRLNEGVYQLNAGNLDRALELLSGLVGKGEPDPYIQYLISLVHFRKGDVDAGIPFLRRAVEKDEHYKVIAFNEPDLGKLLDNREFRDLVS